MLKRITTAVTSWTE